MICPKELVARSVKPMNRILFKLDLNVDVLVQVSASFLGVPEGDTSIFAYASPKHASHRTARCVVERAW